jgi:IclR family transcriptional regulator, KDG regulon repressor
MADEHVSKHSIIEKAFLILDAFTPEQPELGVREIARLVKLPPSTVGRILVTLRDCQVLLQNTDTQQYRLGSRVIRWARSSQQANGLRELGLPILKALNQSTGETATLSIIQGTNRLVLERVESSHAMRYVINPGDVMPLHSGASGKVFLAFMDASQRDAVLRSTSLPAYTENTITDRTRLMKELAQIKLNGYATSVGERVPDAASVAAPVFNAAGEVIATINISGPITRLNQEHLKKYQEHVISASQELSRALEYIAG